MNYIDENVSAIFLTKTETSSYDVTLTFVLNIKASNELIENMLIVVQDFSEVMTYNRDEDLNINYDYNVLFHIPPKEHIVCCLFAWHEKYLEHIPINFLTSPLRNISIPNRLRATLQQLLVNRIVKTTRIVRALYLENTKTLELSCVYYSSDAGVQLRLLKDIAQLSELMFPNMVIQTNIIALSFDEDIESCPLYRIRFGEWALFS